jgi:hypothetical protein
VEWLLYIGGAFLIGSLIGIIIDNSNSAGNNDELSSSYSRDDNDLFSPTDSSFESSSCPSINPASGLHMIGNSCIDVEGNPFGTSTSNMFEMSQIDNDLFDSNSISDTFQSDFDSFGSYSSLDDPFNTTTI